jgi:hypothetical protein
VWHWDNNFYEYRNRPDDLGQDDRESGLLRTFSVPIESERRFHFFVLMRFLHANRCPLRWKTLWNSGSPAGGVHRSNQRLHGRYSRADPQNQKAAALSAAAFKVMGSTRTGRTSYFHRRRRRTTGSPNAPTTVQGLGRGPEREWPNLVPAQEPASAQPQA